MCHRNRLASTAEWIGTQADLLIAPNLFSTSFPVWFSSMNLVWLNYCAGRFCRYVRRFLLFIYHYYIKYDPVSSGQLSMAPCTGKMNSLVWKSNGCSIYRNPQPQQCTLYLFTYCKKTKDNAETCTGLSRAFHPTLWPIDINYQNVTFNSPIPRHDVFFSAVFYCSDFKFAPGTLFSRCLRFGALPFGSCRPIPRMYIIWFVVRRTWSIPRSLKMSFLKFCIVLIDVYLLNLLGVGYVWSQEDHK